MQAETSVVDWGSLGREWETIPWIEVLHIMPEIYVLLLQTSIRPFPRRLQTKTDKEEDCANGKDTGFEVRKDAKSTEIEEGDCEEDEDTSEETDCEVKGQ